MRHRYREKLRVLSWCWSASLASPVFWFVLLAGRFVVYRGPLNSSALCDIYRVPHVSGRSGLCNCRGRETTGRREKILKKMEQWVTNWKSTTKCKQIRDRADLASQLFFALRLEGVCICERERTFVFFYLLIYFCSFLFPLWF